METFYDKGVQMSISLDIGGAEFYQKIRMVRGFKTESFKTVVLLCRVNFGRAIPIKYFPNMSYDLKPAL